MPLADFATKLDAFMDAPSPGVSSSFADKLGSFMDTGETAIRRKDAIDAAPPIAYHSGEVEGLDGQKHQLDSGERLLKSIEFHRTYKPGDFGVNLARRLPFAGAAIGATEALYLRGAMNRIAADKGTKEDYGLAGQFLADQEKAQAEADRRGNLEPGAIARGGANIASHIPGMGVEFWMTGGAASAGRAVAGKATFAAIQKLLTKAGTRAAMRNVGGRLAIKGATALGETAGAAAARGALLIPTHAPQEIAQQMQPQTLSIEEGPDGRLKAIIPEGAEGEPLWKAIPKGLGSHFTNMFSEEVGGLLRLPQGTGKAVSAWLPSSVRATVGKLAKAEVVKRIMGGDQQVLRAIKGLGAYAGRHNPLAESVEERVKEGLDYGLGISPDAGTLGDIASGNLKKAAGQIGSEMFGFGLASGAGHAAGVAGSYLPPEVRQSLSASLDRLGGNPTRKQWAAEGLPAAVSQQGRIDYVANIRRRLIDPIPQSPQSPQPETTQVADPTESFDDTQPPKTTEATTEDSTQPSRYDGMEHSQLDQIAKSKGIPGWNRLWNVNKKRAMLEARDNAAPAAPGSPVAAPAAEAAPETPPAAAAPPRARERLPEPVTPLDLPDESDTASRVAEYDRLYEKLREDEGRPWRGQSNWSNAQLTADEYDAIARKEGVETSNLLYRLHSKGVPTEGAHRRDGKTTITIGNSVRDVAESAKYRDLNVVASGEGIFRKFSISGSDAELKSLADSLAEYGSTFVGDYVEQSKPAPAETTPKPPQPVATPQQAAGEAGGATIEPGKPYIALSGGKPAYAASVQPVVPTGRQRQVKPLGDSPHATRTVTEHEVETADKRKMWMRAEDIAPPSPENMMDPQGRPYTGLDLRGKTAATATPTAGAVEDLVRSPQPENENVPLTPSPATIPDKFDWEDEARKEFEQEVYGVHNERVRADRAALRELFGSDKELNLLRHKLKRLAEKGGDYSNVPGFDEKVDVADKRFKFLLAGKGDPSQNLVDKIIRGENLIDPRRREVKEQIDAMVQNARDQHIADLESHASDGGGPARSTPANDDFTVFAHVPIPGLDILNAIDFKTVGKAAGNWLRKWFVTGGHLPSETFEGYQNFQGQVAAHGKEASFALRDYGQAARKLYGSVENVPQPVQAAINEFLTNGGPIAAVPAELRAPVARFRVIVDVLSVDLVRIGAITGGTAGKAMTNFGRYMNRSYQVFSDPNWAAKVDPAVRARAGAEIQTQNPSATPQQIDVMLNSLLFNEKAADTPYALIRAARKGSKDLSITIPRQQIPVWLRDLWGEFKDPRANFARTVAKQAHLLESHRFLAEVRAQGLGKFLFDPKAGDPKHTPEYHAIISAEGNAAMAPLDGLMTTPEIKQAFENAYGNKNHLPTWFRVVLAGNMAAKAAKTVLSEVATLRNFLSNPMFAVAQGTLGLGSIQHFPGGVKHAAFGVGTELPWTKDQTWRDYVVRLTGLNVIGTSANTGELRATLNDVAGGNMFDAMGILADKSKMQMSRNLGKVAKGLWKVAQQTYQAADDVWRIYNFEVERARYKAADKSLSDAELDKIAADLVRDTNPTYSMQPEAVQQLRKTPFGPFPMFSAEVARIAVKTLTQIIPRELANPNPKIKLIGAQRLAGILTVAAAPSALVAAAMMMFGVPDDDDEAIRKSLPPWQRNSQFLHLGRNDDGSMRMVDISYLDAFSYLRKPILAFFNGGSVADKMTEAAREAGSPFANEQLVTSKLVDIARNTTGEGRSVHAPYGYSAGTDAALESLKDDAAHVWSGLEPGTVTTLKELWKGIEGRVSDSGKKYDPKVTIGKMLTGQRIQDVDFRQALHYRASGFNRDTSEAARRFNKRALNVGDVPEAELAAEYAHADSARKALFDELHETIVADLKLGMSFDEVRGVLKGAGISKERADNLIAGVYEPIRPGGSLDPGELRSKPGGERRLQLIAEQAVEHSPDPSKTRQQLVEDHEHDMVKQLDALAAKRPGRTGKSAVDAEKLANWERERAEAKVWLRQARVDLPTAQRVYFQHRAKKIKTPQLRNEAIRRMSSALTS